jgi:RNA polymerase primary sigma factor
MAKDKTEVIKEDIAAAVALETTDQDEEVLELTPDDLGAEEIEEEEIELLDNDTYFDDITDDSVKMYLREIGRVPLLTQEEELKLANQIAKNAPKIAKLETRLEKAREKKDAVKIDKFEEEIRKLKIPSDKMAEANMRLVVSIAKKYLGRGLDLLDLIQEGNTGLLRAVEKFDPGKGNRFSTYATWWIRQGITRAISDQSRTIRIPVHMMETIGKMKRARVKLTQELNRNPTNEELARELDLELDKVEHVIKIQQDIGSLDAKLKNSDDDEDSTLLDFQEDEDIDTPEESAATVLLKEQLGSVLEELSDRERKILIMRFGLDNTRPHTLEEVGLEFDVTRERIRQIESKALVKLRKNPNIKKLHDYIK